MVTRVSTASVFNTTIDNLAKRQKELAIVQDQIASNSKILTAADNPIDALRVVALKNSIAQKEQFGDNMVSARNRLELEGSVLTSITDLLRAVKVRTIEAGNGGLSTTDMREIGTSIEALLGSIVQLANSRDRNGEYIFAGSKMTQQPFVQDNSGSYTYQGNDVQALARLGETLEIPVSDSGEKVFFSQAMFAKTTANINNAISVTSNNAPTANISTGYVTDALKWKRSQQPPENYIIQFEPLIGGVPPAAPTDVDGTTAATNDAQTFSVYSATTGKVITGDDGQPMQGLTVKRPTSSDNIVEPTVININGMVVEVTMDQSIKDAATGLPRGPQRGDRFIVEAEEQKNVLNVINDFAKFLKSHVVGSSEANIAVNDQIQRMIASIDEASDSALAVTTEVGLRQENIRLQEDVSSNIILSQRKALGEISDLDFAQAVSELSILQTTLQATQLAFSRVQNLTLFNFL
ncbi:flagellar hook-associated protein FlgL [Piscirickettsia litoralis]|uniref:Flagellar hook-associated protein 3 n=1 Tax=Piscirickettsia litoralis TaxID=1891921 RepID=A0ABX2ZZI0_9GAMM|nr:flagellar hook-associated protein FlgL [Piscirickettsia litoralis]ODN41996.1 flagellar hook-associated protein 3 [Piscirickettsia litoralis]